MTDIRDFLEAFKHRSDDEVPVTGPTLGQLRALSARVEELDKVLREVVRTCKAECPAGVPALDAAIEALKEQRND